MKGTNREQSKNDQKANCIGHSNELSIYSRVEIARVATNTAECLVTTLHLSQASLQGLKELYNPNIQDSHFHGNEDNGIWYFA